MSGGTYVSTNHAAAIDALATREIHGVNLTGSPSRAELESLAALADAGRLRVTIDTEISLAEAPDALVRSRAGHARGKTVIVP
ncbi:zinc-binding dehydrogenase [Streptomyces tailanensis]|uniref:zinc-binding dehydrogenase n=1 Tax=Streptomyces tailanensis TaxID=2569858 RepID=UPI001FE47BAA|nr:zinc-binding dehydrogenase [Streptomyces tailanensis]